MAGWISIHRSIQDHWLWDCEFSYGQAWVDLLLGANHSGRTISIKGTPIKLERGQQARSELTLSKTWKWSRGKVRRFLKKLINEQMIVQQTGRLTSIITICNYETFQDSSKQGDTADGTTGSTSGGTTTEHQVVQQPNTTRYTDNNVNNGNNENKVNKKEKDNGDKAAFEIFWNAGMRKTDKKQAFPIFTKLAKDHGGAEAFANQLANDVRARIATGQYGFDILSPMRYLKNERFTDEVKKQETSNGTNQQRPARKSSVSGIKEDMRILAERRAGGKGEQTVWLDGDEVRPALDIRDIN